MSPPPISAVAAQAATRLNLKLGRDGVLRGTCPCCNYPKPTIALSVQDNGITVSCITCGNTSGIAAAGGIPLELLRSYRPDSSKVERAVQLWEKARPASGTLVERYLRGRGITKPIPLSIRYLGRQRNWSDGRLYPAMASLVARVPGDQDKSGGRLHLSGVHLTFLSAPEASGRVRKAPTETNKLALGQLRHGGVWLNTIAEVEQDLAVAEGVETALSVQQLTGLPTVAALSASGIRSFRWPPMIRRILIAADNDEVGLEAARQLRTRAQRAGIFAVIKIPSNGQNDFNDLIKEQ